MKKSFLVILTITLILPQISFAAWWNPFSWSIFHRTDTKAQILEKRIAELEQKLASTTATTTIQTPVIKTPVNKEDSKVVVPNTPSPKSIQKIQPSPAVVQQPEKSETFTLPNGAVIDKNGNVIQAAPQQAEIQPKRDDVSIGINYFNQNKTCIGLSGEQYNYCVNYALNPTVSTPQQTTQSAIQIKQARLDEINRKIADLNAKYSSDSYETYHRVGGTLSSQDAALQRLDTEYNINYNTLKAEYQQILYSN